MKKNRKRLILIASICILGTLSTLTTFASNPRGAVIACGECGRGTITTAISRSYEHNETFPCSHHDHGTDTYKVYEVIERMNCDSCAFSSTSKYEDHILYICSGY